MKKIIIWLLLLSFSFSFSQEIELEKDEKIKIGKFNYNLYFENGFNYELGYWIISYYIKKGNKKQYIGPYLTFYINEIDSNRHPQIGEGFPPMIPRPYKDREVLGLGNLDIDEKKKTITVKYKEFVKDDADSPDSSSVIMKQKKDGFFESLLHVKYRNGKKEVIFDKTKATTNDETR